MRFKTLKFLLLDKRFNQLSHSVIIVHHNRSTKLIDPLISKSGRYFQEGGFLGWVFFGIYTLDHIMYIAIANANSDIIMVKCYSKSTSIRWFSCFSDRNYNSVSPRIPLPYIAMCIEFWWPIYYTLTNTLIG